MAEINPYAPVVIEDPSSSRDSIHERIFFAGTLSETDCQTVLRDQAAGGNAFAGLFPLAIFVLSLVALQWFVGVTGALLPVLWIVGAIVISPIWMRLVGKYWQQGARTKYAKAGYLNAKPTRGWCDQDGLVKFDETSAIKATWQHFDRAILFERVINLVVQADARLRVVLPWHFFASADEYAAARRLLANKLPDAGAKGAKNLLEVSPKLHFDGQPRIVDVERINQWSADQWPFPSTPDQQSEFVLEPSRVINSLTVRLKVLAMAVAFLLSFGFPFLVGLGGFALLKYYTTGGWDYLWTDWFFHIIILIPTILFLGFLVLVIAGRIRAMREAQQRLLFLRLRDEGIYIRREGIEVWMKSEEIVSTEVDEETVGWSMPVQVDPVRFPKAIFADEESFRDFGEQLSRYRREMHS